MTGRHVAPPRSDHRELPSWLHNQLFFKVDRFADDYGQMQDRNAAVEMSDAHVISSRLGMDPEVHRPLFDIDHRAVLLESSTAGHYHLFIDHPMDWRKYKRLLRALMRAGIIEPGYYRASVARRGTHLRLPWVKK